MLLLDYHYFVLDFQSRGKLEANLIDEVTTVGFETDSLRASQLIPF